MKRVTFYEDNELNHNWNSLFEDKFECNNLIKIENAILDLCCRVKLLWKPLMIFKHTFIQEKMNWTWRYILKPKEEVFVSDAENCYQFFLLNVIFLLHKSFVKYFTQVSTVSSIFMSTCCTKFYIRYPKKKNDVL